MKCVVPSLAALLSLKERWRVSIKAQIKRLVDLEIIPPEYATGPLQALLRQRAGRAKNRSIGSGRSQSRVYWRTQ